MDDSIAREVKEKSEEVNILKAKLTDKEREVTNLSDHILRLQVSKYKINTLILSLHSFT